jgi:ketosteroid isomerase-like protein
MSPRIFLAVLALAGSAAPLAGQDRSVDAALTAVYARFTEAYKRADARMVADLYSEDAYYLQPDAEVLQGRPAVLGVFRSFLDPIKAQNKPGPAIYFDILEREISGNLGWDIGYYRMGPAGSDSASATRGGKFIVLWRKDPDGQWRIHTDGYSGLGKRPCQ